MHVQKIFAFTFMIQDQSFWALLRIFCSIKNIQLHTWDFFSYPLYQILTVKKSTQAFYLISSDLSNTCSTFNQLRADIF